MSKRRGIIGCLWVIQTSPLEITILKHPNQQNHFKLESRDPARLAKVLLLTRCHWERGKIYRQPDPPTFPRRALIVGTCLLSDCLRLASRAIVQMLQQRATDRNNYPFSLGLLIWFRTLFNSEPNKRLKAHAPVTGSARTYVVAQLITDLKSALEEVERTWHI